MERDGRNKTLFRCLDNYTLSKFIVGNGLEDLWIRENPDSSEFICYDNFSGTRSMIDRFYTDRKIASNTKINHIIVFFTDHYHVTFIDRFPSKTKTWKDLWYFNNFFLYKFELSLTTKTFLFFIRNTKHSHSSETGAVLEISKRVGELCQPPWLPDEENFKFWVV